MFEINYLTGIASINGLFFMFLKFRGLFQGYNFVLGFGGANFCRLLYGLIYCCKSVLGGHLFVFVCFFGCVCLLCRVFDVVFLVLAVVFRLFCGFLVLCFRVCSVFCILSCALLCYVFVLSCEYAERRFHLFFLGLFVFLGGLHFDV